MNQKLKQYLKTMIFLFGISFFIIGCQKDDDVNTLQQEPLKTQDLFKVSKVGKHTIDENKDLLSRLSSLSEKVEQSRLANANKNIYSSEDDFYINTDFATYLENNDTGYHSYTFPVFRTEQVDGVENVLLSLQEDGSYKAFLIGYDLNEQEQLNLENELNVDLTDKTTIYSLEDDSFIDDIFSKVSASGDCVGILMCPYKGEDGQGEEHPAGQGCIDENRGDLYLDTSICGSGGGADTSDTTGQNNSSGSDTSVGHVEAGGTGSGSTVVTIPQPWEEVALCLGLNSSFTSDMAIWLQAQPKNVAGPINGFLQNDDCNEESQEFAVQGIEALMDGGEVDFEDKIIYTINKPCQKELVKNLMALTTSYTTLINSTFGVSENVNVKFWNGTLQGQNATTNPFFSGTQDNFIIKIGLDDDFLDTATDLAIIAAVLHELSHAYFISLYLQNELEATNSEYSTLLNSFIAFYENATQDTFDNTDNEIHNAMNDFIIQIANTLYNYAQINNIEGVSTEYCTSLAWGTMLGTNLINEMLNEDEIGIANNIMLTEQNNNEYDPSFPIKGTPCE